VRWTTGQPHLVLAIVQARRFSLFCHIVLMPDETDAKKTLTASPEENWRRQPGRPHTTWTKTIQEDLKSNNLSLNEAINVAQNHPLWRLMSTFGATKYACRTPSGACWKRRRRKRIQNTSKLLFTFYDKILLKTRRELQQADQ